MKQQVKIRLVNEYSKLKIIGKSTCLKFERKFTDTNLRVLLYFDAFDENNLSLTLILNLENKFYYTTLNINDTDLRVEYLDCIPENMLKIILDKDFHLNGFFTFLEDMLMGNYSPTGYNKDVIFHNTIKYNKKNRKDLPFLSGISRKNMSDTMYNNLIHTMGINYKVVDKIKADGFTLTRTDNPSKRKSITAIVKHLNIKIDL